MIMKENSKMPLKQIQNLTIRRNSNIDCDIYCKFNAFPLNLTATQKSPTEFPQSPWEFITVPTPIPYPYPWKFPYPRQP